MTSFTKLLLLRGQSTFLTGLLETDRDCGRAIHFAAPNAVAHEISFLSNAAALRTSLLRQGVVSAADMAISADWRLELYNQSTITNRLFLTLTAGGHATDRRYSIKGSAYADEVHNAGRIAGAINLGDCDNLPIGLPGAILGLVEGGTGDDRMLSGQAAETLLGGHGQDWLDGGDGADSLNGGVSADTLFGGVGDDVILVGRTSLQDIMNLFNQ